MGRRLTLLLPWIVYCIINCSTLYFYPFEMWPSYSCTPFWVVNTYIFSVLCWTSIFDAFFVQGMREIILNILGCNRTSYSDLFVPYLFNIHTYHTYHRDNGKHVAPSPWGTLVYKSNWAEVFPRILFWSIYNFFDFSNHPKFIFISSKISNIF